MATVGQKNATKFGRSRFESVPIGSVAYGSFGNATTTVAGTIYWSEINVSRNVTLKGIAVLNGGTVGTDKGIVAIYDNAGALVANSALAGATTAGANAFQTYDFTSPVVLPAGQYFIAYQSNGTTDNIRTIAASTFVITLTASATGAFATLTPLTIPTTVTANVGPIGYAYV